MCRTSWAILLLNDVLFWYIPLGGSNDNTGVTLAHQLFDMIPQNPGKMAKLSRLSREDVTQALYPLVMKPYALTHLLESQFLDIRFEPSNLILLKPQSLSVRLDPPQI